MSQEAIFRVFREGLLLILLLSAGPVLASMIVGLITGILQATTQIQEPTLTSVPKMIAVFVVLAIGGPWMVLQIVRFATVLFESIPLIR